MVGVQYATGDPHADTHEYDATGRRMRSKFDDATDWTNYVYDEVTGNLIAEYSLISGTYSLSATYTWGAGLLKQQRGSTKRFYHFDGSGNTSALTDASQSITDTYSYNAFGVVISGSGSSVNPFRWLGQVGAYDDGSRGSASGLLFAEPTYVLLTYRIPINIRKQLGAPGRPSGPTNLEEWGKQMEKEIVQLVEDLAEAVSGAASGVTSWLEDIVTHLSDTALILVMLGKVSTSKAVYGDYCGPQSNMPPVGASGFQNPLDECCYNHDKAWAEAKPPCTVHDQCRSQCINATITLCKCLRDKRCGLLDFKCRKMQIIFLAYACNINTWCTVF